MDRTDKAGLYFHIPFCRGKCPYCDFYSLVSKVCTDEYIACLCDEIKTRRRMKEFLSGDELISVDTVYFGGGTPSLMTGVQLQEVISAVKSGFSVDENAEITVDCNPSSPGLQDFLQKAAAAGVNRVSLGMQSASDNERKSLGRAGGRESVENAVYLARNAGIENISLDIMIGVPDSSISSLEKTLEFALSLGVPHISAYMLKLEEGTHFYKNQHKLHLPDEDETADMYLFMSRYLKACGFVHYEISNFCKDGCYSRHNMKYWEGAPYLGIGPAAHSFYNKKRFYFPRDINAFINAEPAVYDGDGGDSEEEILLGLRTVNGVALSGKNDLFIKKARLFADRGFGNITEDNRFVLSAEGYLVSNSIISALLSVY